MSDVMPINEEALVDSLLKPQRSATANASSLKAIGRAESPFDAPLC